MEEKKIKFTEEEKEKMVKYINEVRGIMLALADKAAEVGFLDHMGMWLSLSGSFHHSPEAIQRLVDTINVHTDMELARMKEKS